MSLRFIRRSKYNARRVHADGYCFGSKAEWRRYGILKLLRREGRIGNLVVHPRYPLVVNGVKIAAYEADFSYVTDKGERIVEDVKGMKTAVYRIKAKLLKALHGIEVREIEARRMSKR